MELPSYIDEGLAIKENDRMNESAVHHIRWLKDMILTQRGTDNRNGRTFVALAILCFSFIPSTMCIFSSNPTAISHFQKGVPKEVPLTSPIKDVTKSTEDFGDQQLFWVMYPSGEEQELATLLSVGTHCYVYMENSCIETQGELNAIAKCDELREAFDSVIYPKGVELAGNPDGTIGDIDGDPKVTLFLGPFFEKSGRLLNGFYTRMNDLEGAFSNYREMFFIDATNTVNDAICLAIHEFNHLIFYNHDMDEADFLTEGLANLAIQYSGYWSTIVDTQARRYTDNPQSSLLYFNRISSDYYWDVSYGQSYLFITYLYERYGLDFVRSLVSIPEDGAIAIQVALTNGGYDVTFNDIYLDWIVACTLDNPEIYEGIYGFTSVNYTINHYLSIGNNYPIHKTDINFNLYGVHARKIYSPLESMVYEIENPQSYALGVSIVILDSSGWRVTQSIHTEQSTNILEYIVGTDVEEVYVITSLMSEDTPTEYGIVYALDEVPSIELDYSIIEGVITTSSDNGFYLIPISAVLFLIPVTIVIYRRRLSNSQILPKDTDFSGVGK